MKLLGIEFGGKQPVNGQSEKKDGEFIEIKTGSRIQNIRQGAGLIEIPGKTAIVEKNQVNVDIYKKYFDY